MEVLSEGTLADKQLADEMRRVAREVRRETSNHSDQAMVAEIELEAKAIHHMLERLPEVFQRYFAD